MTTAVVAVHYQNDVLQPEGRIGAGLAGEAEGRAEVIRNARRLLDGARGHGVPVVSVRIAFPAGHAGVRVSSPMFAAAVERDALVEGSWGARFHEQLEPLPGEPVVTHARINAFYDSDLETVLSGLGAERLVVAGVATHSAVEHTARHAADMGFEVVLAADACGAADRELHESSLRVLALHVARVDTVDGVLAAMEDGHG